MSNISFNYFFGKSHFEDDEILNYLVFKQVHKYFKTPTNREIIIAWDSIGLLDESIKAPLCHSSINPILHYIGNPKYK